LYDLGDLNRDGINDIVTDTRGFIIEYNGGQFLDSYIDAGMRWGTITATARLGDIDSSGVASFAIGFGGAPGGIALYKVSDSIPPTGEYQELPHAASFKCEHAASVPTHNGVDRMLSLCIIPNPSHGEVRLEWSSGLAATGNLTLTDAGGAVQRSLPVHPGMSQITISTHGLSPGAYFVRLDAGDRTATASLVVR